MSLASLQTGDIEWIQAVRRNRLVGKYRRDSSKTDNYIFLLLTHKMNHFSAQVVSHRSFEPHDASSRLRVSSQGKTKVTQCHLVEYNITAAARSARVERQKQLNLHVRKNKRTFRHLPGSSHLYLPPLHGDIQGALELCSAEAHRVTTWTSTNSNACQTQQINKCIFSF